jgi:hypothetical protein
VDFLLKKIERKSKMVVFGSLLAEALIREYLTRHSLTSVLDAFNVHRPRGPHAISKTGELAKTLGLERPLKKNKEKGDAALKSLIEVLAEYLAAKTSEKSAATAKPADATPAQPADTTPAVVVGASQNTSPPAPASAEALLMPPARAPHNLQAARTAGSKEPASNCKSASGDIVLEEVEEFDDAEDACSGGGGDVSTAASRGRRVCDAEATARPISMAEAGDLRKVVFGKTAKASFNSAWTQGFFAASTQGLSYGLVQTAGGPCGLLATVQAFLLRHLIFVDSSLAASRPPAQCSPHAFEIALFNGLADIIWQAGGGQRASVAVFLGMRCLSTGEQEELRQAQCRPDEFTELLTVFLCSSREQVCSAHDGGTRASSSVQAVC